MSKYAVFRVHCFSFFCDLCSLVLRVCQCYVFFAAIINRIVACFAAIIALVCEVWRHLFCNGVVSVVVYFVTVSLSSFAIVVV